MLRPSYSELMDVINKDADIDDKVTSSYAIVIAAAKRARQLINGAEPMAAAKTDKSVSIAVNEMFEGLIHVMPEAAYGEDTAGQQSGIEQSYQAYYGGDDFSDDSISMDDSEDDGEPFVPDFGETIPDYDDGEFDDGDFGAEIEESLVGAPEDFGGGE